MPKTYIKPDHEYYPTPDEPILSLFDVIDFESLKKTWKFAEPCRGQAKAIYKYFPEDSEYCEIAEGKDYLTSTWEGALDCIITNPPFSLATKFLEKSFKEADVCIYLLRLAFLEAKVRKTFHQEHPVDHLIVLSKRPSFIAGRTDKTAYAWFIYDPKKRLGLKQTIYVV